MGHPADGVLRRFLDEPAAVSDVDRAHLGTCSRCAAELGRADADREVVARSLAETAGHHLDDDQVDRAWLRLVAELDRTADATVHPLPGPAGATRRRRLTSRRPVAVVVTAGLVLLGGTAAAAASGWLPIFGTEKVAPLNVSDADLRALDSAADRLRELADYGDVDVLASMKELGAADAATAQQLSGLPLPRLAKLPDGLMPTPRYTVLQREVSEFTFLTAKATQASGAAGLPVPKGLDGARLRVEIGPGVGQTWADAQGFPALDVLRIKAPTVTSSGADLAAVVDYLTSVPGLTPEVKQQLRDLVAGKALPLPVVPGERARTVRVGAAEATVLQATDRYTLVTWVADDRLHLVTGTLEPDQLIEVARGLR